MGVPLISRSCYPTVLFGETDTDRFDRFDMALFSRWQTAISTVAAVVWMQNLLHQCQFVWPCFPTLSESVHAVFGSQHIIQLNYKLRAGLILRGGLI